MSTSPEPESSTFPKFSSTVISNIKLSSDRLWRMFLLLQKFWKVSPLLNLLRTITIVLTFENVYRSRARVLAFSKVSHKVISDRRGLLRIFKDQHYSWVHILNWVASRLLRMSTFPDSSSSGQSENFQKFSKCGLQHLPCKKLASWLLRTPTSPDSSSSG